jgi:hypothetical protein
MGIGDVIEFIWYFLLHQAVSIIHAAVGFLWVLVLEFFLRYLQHVWPGIIAAIGDYLEDRAEFYLLLQENEQLRERIQRIREETRVLLERANRLGVGVSDDDITDEDDLRFTDEELELEEEDLD